MAAILIPYPQSFLRSAVQTDLLKITCAIRTGFSLGRMTRPSVTTVAQIMRKEAQQQLLNPAITFRAELGTKEDQKPSKTHRETKNFITESIFSIQQGQSILASV
jgi:hypothetical protein